MEVEWYIRPPICQRCCQKCCISCLALQCCLIDDSLVLMPLAAALMREHLG